VLAGKGANWGEKKRTDVPALVESEVADALKMADGFFAGDEMDAVGGVAETTGKGGSTPADIK
jgi:hypothetical protein